MLKGENTISRIGAITMTKSMQRNVLLLTGAGFTHNFGGFLAREMWSKIFNNPLLQAIPDVRDLLLKDFDFESVYSIVLTGGRYTPEAKEAVRVAVEDAYKDLDDSIKGWTFNLENPLALNIYGLGDLLSFLSQRGSESGWFFTLNQDLLMERQHDYRSPGVAQVFDYGIKGNAKKAILPKEAEPAKKDLNNSSYIKLHGSYAWASSNGGNQMVIGKNKSENISQEPLLKWYMEIFMGQIFEKNKKLLVIGYGFGDAHINDILLKGVQEYGLSIYIVNPTDPEIVKNKLEGKPSHFGSWEVSKYAGIWNGVKGYFPYSLRQIFPPDQNETTILKEIKKSLS
ncbi:MAG: SIR2 family protein [Candidatus Taylorbacteria bacterium]|nr:SIR2 family protein [Candidatus Taylorbacteria bacterium]